MPISATHEGLIHMVSGTRDNPPYWGNFIERLYEKKLSLLAESNMTLLKYLFKPPDIFLRLSFFPFIRSVWALLSLFCFCNENLCFKTWNLENTWHSARRELSRVGDPECLCVLIWEKVVPPARVTLPAETRQLAQPSCPAPPRQLGEDHINGRWNLSKILVKS